MCYTKPGLTGVVWCVYTQSDVILKKLPKINMYICIYNWHRQGFWPVTGQISPVDRKNASWQTKPLLSWLQQKSGHQSRWGHEAKNEWLTNRQLYYDSDAIHFTLKTEAKTSSETLVSYRNITRRHNSDDLDLEEPSSSNIPLKNHIPNSPLPTKRVKMNGNTLETLAWDRNRPLGLWPNSHCTLKRTQQNRTDSVR